MGYRQQWLADVPDYVMRLAR